MKKDLINFYLIIFALLGPPLLALIISDMLEVKRQLYQAYLMIALYLFILPPIVNKVAKAENK